MGKIEALLLPRDKSFRVHPSGKKPKLFYVLFVSLFLFANLGSFVHIGNRVITTSEIIMLFIVLTLLPSLKVRWSDSLVFISILIIGLISVLYSIDPNESLKSFFSLGFYSFFTLAMVQAARREPYFIDLFLDAFLTAVFILSIYALFQSIYIYMFGTVERIIYPFGIFTWHTQSQLLISWRANSLYYEPNIFGMVSVFGLLLNLYLGKRAFYWNVMVLFSIILTFATTTYFMLVISLAAQLLIGEKGFKSLDKGKFFLLTIFALFFFTTLFLSPGTDKSFFRYIPVLNRIREVSTPGTSGHYRITAPISSLPYMFTHYPFGVGLGAIDAFLIEPPSEISNYFIKGHSSYGKTVDNIILGWFFSFGLFASLFLGFFINLLRKTITTVSVSLAVCMFIFCWGTGSFLFIEFWALLLILIFLNLSYGGSGRALLAYENLHA